MHTRTLFSLYHTCIPTLIQSTQLFSPHTQSYGPSHTTIHVCSPTTHTHTTHTHMHTLTHTHTYTHTVQSIPVPGVQWVRRNPQPHPLFVDCKLGFLKSVRIKSASDEIKGASWLFWCAWISAMLILTCVI